MQGPRPRGKPLVHTYKYKALDRSGQVAGGRVEATSEADAVARVAARRLEAFEVSRLPKQVSLGRRAARVTPKRLARYIRQLATLLDAGVTLMDAMRSLGGSNASPQLSEASRAIEKDLRSGRRLSQAMETHLPQLPLYVPRLAELGEATGNSAKALGDAADRMEFDDEMRAQLRTSLSYPVFLMVVGTLIVGLMFVFVVPRFDEMIGEDQSSLPGVSKLVLNTGRAIKNNVPLAGLVVLGLFALTLFVMRSPALRERIRLWLERIPLVGRLLVQSDLGGWAQTLGMALTNGAPLLPALELAEAGVRSPRLRAAFVNVRREIKTGRNIEAVLDEEIPDFDPLTIDLIRTGRTSSSLGEMFLFIGTTQERETRDVSKRLAALAEPIAILSISAVVGTIVIGIVLAMTSLYDFAV